LQGRDLSDLPFLIESVKPSVEISSDDIHSLVVVLIRSLGDANLLEVVDGRERVIGWQHRPSVTPSTDQVYDRLHPDIGE
jgi:hypothetical protein